MKKPHEPLTAEERQLAAQLAKLGPHGGPSPQLDARILSAARTAVQGRSVPAARRPRWPLGLGVAASVLLAVGVAWQLRPLQEVPVASEVPTEAMSAPAAPEAADAAAVAASDSAAPAPSRVMAPPAPANPLPAPASSPKPSRDPARQNAEAAARKEAVPRRSPLSVIPSVPGLPVPVEAPAPPAPAQESVVASEAARAPSASIATSVDREAAAVQFRDAEAQRREQDQRATAERELAESRTLDRVGVSGSRTRAKRADAYGGTPPPALAAPPAPPPPAASAGSSAEPGAARTALRRTDLQVPVDEDTKLPEDEWLDRIRLRRDLGDAANATRSLQLFVQEHPFQRIPDDLRPLLGDP
jgi:hypothetical protein